MKKVQIVLSVGLLLSNGVFAQTPTLDQVLTNGNKTTKAILMSATSTPNPNNTGADLPYNKISFHNADFALENVRIEGYYGNGHFVDRGGLKLYTRGGDGLQPRLVINPGGFVGIGNNAPTQRLEVNGNSMVNGTMYSTATEGIRLIQNGAYIAAHNSANATRTGYLQFNAGLNVILAAENGNRLTLATNGVERINVLNNGNVGIGTANPGTYKLAVEGVLGARKVKVTQAAWADYVFDSSYQLKPLAEVDKFIQEHKHLPEVPTATEISKDGIDVGDSQALLLKKIEELTLYIIQQNKDMQELKKEVAELKKVQAGK